MTQQTKHPKKVTGEKQTSTEMVIAKIAETKQQEKQSAGSEERHRKISEAAYFMAEQRGFQGDMVLDDWLQAEAQVDARLVAKH